MNQHPTPQQIEDLISNLQDELSIPEEKPEAITEVDLNPWAVPPKCKDCD